MAGSDENCPDMMRPSNGQGGLRAIGGKSTVSARRTRSALSTVNTNIMGAPLYTGAVKRGVLTEKNGVADNKPRVPRHRQGAKLGYYSNFKKISVVQVAEKQKQPVVEDRKRSFWKTAASNWESEGCIIVNGKDYMPHDQLQETDVEMEDAEEELVIDIDSADKNNPLACVEYIDDLYCYYKKIENSSRVPQNYMMQQLDINGRMRGILIDWLVEVHYKFELMEETLYLTVNLIDRFLAIQKMVRKKLQLVGVTAMLLACKYEEVSVPVVEDLILISDKAYTRKEVIDMERLMANSLQFNLSVPTPYVFMTRFLKAARADRKLELLSFFMIELCLVQYEMLKYPPSLLAAAAVFTAQSTCVGRRQWSKTCEKHTHYTEDQLLECSRLMVTFHQMAGTGKLTGVHRKYSTSKYGYAAKTEPADFLLENC
ncbi:hypothetical protein Leryth_011771 [Lithospermum erythrorhizon]|nr:hypothetical protein Leryth_011771 [Lithospermum erythrorhizon]